MVEQETQRAIAEVQAAIMLAKRFPRNQAEAMDRILMSCQRQSLAEQSVYSYSRGGSEITGPSIRLAEAIAQQWGNMQFGIRELEQKNGESTVEAFAWDVETNTRQVKVFQVPHVRHTRQGAKRLEDPRDIYEMIANQGARRLRACILGVIPGDVVDAAVDQCEATMKAKADTSPEGIKKLVAAFAPFGVTSDMIAKRIQRTNLESITPAQVVALKKVYASLRDGMSTPATWFDGFTEEAKAAPTSVAAAVKPKETPNSPQDAPEAGKGKGKGKAAQEKAAEQPATPSAEAPPDPMDAPFGAGTTTQTENQALHDLLAQLCKGDEGQMVSYLRFMTKDNHTLEDLLAGKVPVDVVAKAIDAANKELEGGGLFS